jgi:hypothetical protein
MGGIISSKRSSAGGEIRVVYPAFYKDEGMPLV